MKRLILATILLATPAFADTAEDDLARDMQKFREEVHARTGAEKEASLKAVKFGLECYENFLKNTAAKSGKPVTASLKEYKMAPEAFADKVVEVCRNAALNPQSGIDKKHWDEAESRFLKKAVLFSLIKDSKFFAN